MARRRRNPFDMYGMFVPDSSDLLNDLVSGPRTRDDSLSSLVAKSHSWVPGTAEYEEGHKAIARLLGPKPVAKQVEARPIRVASLSEHDQEVLKRALDLASVTSLSYLHSILQPTHWVGDKVMPLEGLGIEEPVENLEVVIPSRVRGSVESLLGKFIGAAIIHDVYAERWIHPHQDPGTDVLVGAMIPRDLHVGNVWKAVRNYVKKQATTQPYLADLLEESGIGPGLGINEL